MHHKIGHYAFVGGVLLSVVAGLIQTTSTFFAFSILLLGFVVGFLSLSTREITPFLVAAIALLLAGSADFQILNVIFDPLGTVLASIFSFIKLFVAPVAMVVALKAVINLAGD